MSDALTAGCPVGTLSHRPEPWLDTRRGREGSTESHELEYTKISGVK